MGRKLRAIEAYKRSKQKGTYKTVVVRSHKKRAKKVFRKSLSKPIKREPLRIQQIIGNNLKKLPRKNSLMSAKIKNKKQNFVEISSKYHYCISSRYY